MELVRWPRMHRTDNRLSYVEPLNGMGIRARIGSDRDQMIPRPHKRPRVPGEARRGSQLRRLDHLPAIARAA